MRRLLPVIVAALVICCGWSGAAGAQSKADYLFTSDIHLNAMGNPQLVDRLAAAPVAQWDRIFASGPQPLPAYGSDTNFELFRLTLAQMKAAVADPAVIFISGDFLAHHYHEQWYASASDDSTAAFDAFVDKTIAYIAYEFNATFPHAQFVIALGNNDSACGNYAHAMRSSFLAHFAAAWAPLVNRDGRAPAFVGDFAHYGQYTATLPDGTRVISVDSNLWSPDALQTCDPAGTARGETVTWFERAVAAAPAGAKTWIIEHIPPGIDPYAVVQKTPPSFYATDVLARFRAVRAADGAPPGLIIAGHLHNDGFRIVDRTPLLLVPSISPNHGNNPSFFVAHVNGGAIDDYDAYALGLLSATPASSFLHEYGFNETYGVHGFTLASLQNMQARIHDDTDGIRERQATHYVAGSLNAVIGVLSWPTYWCANVHLDPASYAACLRAP